VVRLDDTEKKLILLLQRDGRMTYVELAERIGVAERTVRRKFKRLTEEGIIQIVTFVDPFRLGRNLRAIIGISGTIASGPKALEQLVRHDSLRYVAMTAGTYDIVVEGHFDLPENLLNFLVTDLSRIGDNVTTNTSIILQFYKATYEWGLGLPVDELEALRREVGLSPLTDNISERNNQRGGTNREGLWASVPASHGLQREGDSRERSLLGPTERQIIGLLQADGRRSYADIARRTKVSEETVRRKVQRLISEGAIQIAAVANPYTVGFNCPVLFGFRVDREAHHSIVRALASCREIVYLVATTGSSDLIAAGYFVNTEALLSFLTNRLGSIRGILNVDVSLILDIKKQSYQWG